MNMASNRCAQDLKASLNMTNQVDLLSHIHGSPLSLLPHQQADPFVVILSETSELVSPLPDLQAYQCFASAASFSGLEQL